MKFTKPFTDEQREWLHQGIREGLTHSDEPRFTFTSQGALKKEAGQIDITLESFFNTDDLNDFRCLDTFCEYLLRLDYDEFEPLIKLFELMGESVAFDVSCHSEASMIEVFVPYEGKEEPEYIDAVYHPAFYTFLKLYAAGHINVRVTAEELIEKLCAFTGYTEEII